jgi:hypothetical protein
MPRLQSEAEHSTGPLSACLPSAQTHHHRVSAGSAVLAGAYRGIGLQRLTCTDHTTHLLSSDRVLVQDLQTASSRLLLYGHDYSSTDSIRASAAGVRSSCPKGILVWGATRAGPLPCKTATPSAGFSHSADSRPCCSWCWLQCRQQTTLQLVLIAQHLQMLTAADTCSLHSCAEDSWLQRCCFGWRQWQPPLPVLLCCADICPADVYARQCLQHSAS